jgi:CcmD family protein
MKMRDRLEPRPKELKNMENAGYLFAAYTVIWAVVFAYVFFLVRKQSGVKRQLESIKEDLKKKQSG